MTDIDTLRFRAAVLQKLRSFFSEHGYTELDTPSLTPALIPDSGHEVFKTAYIDPWTDEDKPLYLVPSHDYFLKKAVAATKAAVFQLSKCFVNNETAGKLHSPEFTLLESYTPGASYNDTLSLMEELFTALLPLCREKGNAAWFKPPFLSLSLDETFATYAGFSLSENMEQEKLAEKVRQLGIAEFPDNPFDDWAINELFELIMCQCIEPALPKDKCVLITGWPVFMPELAKENSWKEMWTLYINGTVTARSRSEETDTHRIKSFLERENKMQNATSRIKQNADIDFWKTFQNYPDCASITLEVDKLIMFLDGKKSIESVQPFPFRLKTGYY